MIKLDKIQGIIRYVLASGRLKGEKPLSCILIGQFECGKTSVIKKYCLKTDGVFYTTDATAYGIIRDSDKLRDFISGKLTHIVIPDLIPCLARRYETVNAFISFMNALIEEGVVSLSTYAIKLSEPAVKRKKEVQVGLITSITKDFWESREQKWLKMGFLSRVLPVTWDYDISTKLEILKYIKKEEHLKEALEKLKLPKRKKLIRLPREFSDKVEPYTIELSAKLKGYGFRIQRQFQTLLKAIALTEGNDEVKQKHFKIFQGLLRFINLDYTKI